MLDPRVQAALGAPGQAAVAARMRELLAGAALVPDAPDRLVQDPYPFRVLPQVDGVTHGALWTLDEVVRRELNARPENALVEAGRTLPTGNFHNAELAAALDSARNALAQSASLIAARVSALLDPRMTGLPPFLADSPGRDSGMMMLEYTAHSAAAEIRSLAMPSGTQTTWASLGVESHASLSSIAVRRTADALEALRVLVATELVVALRAIRHAGRTPAGAGTQRHVRARRRSASRWTRGPRVRARRRAGLRRPGALGEPSRQASTGASPMRRDAPADAATTSAIPTTSLALSD